MEFFKKLTSVNAPDTDVKMRGRVAVDLGVWACSCAVFWLGAKNDLMFIAVLALAWIAVSGKLFGKFYAKQYNLIPVGVALAGIGGFVPMMMNLGAMDFLTGMALSIIPLLFIQHEKRLQKIS